MISLTAAAGLLCPCYIERWSVSLPLLVSSHPPPHTLCVEQLPHLLEQTDHVGVLANSQTKRHGQSLLVLQTAGVELGPELHLQLTILLLRKLKLCHTALQLQEDRQKEDRQEADRQEETVYFLHHSLFNRQSQVKLKSTLQNSLW